MEAKSVRRRSYLVSHLAESNKSSITNDSSEALQLCDFKLKPIQNNGELLKKCKAQIIEDGKDIKGIINKYHKKIGYLKKCHARSDAQTKMEQLLQENPMDFLQNRKRRASQDERKRTIDRASDRTSDTSESPEKPGKKLPLLPLTTKANVVTKRGRSYSRAIEEKFQNLFQEPDFSPLPSLSNCSCRSKGDKQEKESLNQTTPVTFADETETTTDFKNIL